MSARRDGVVPSSGSANGTSSLPRLSPGTGHLPSQGVLGRLTAWISGPSERSAAAPPLTGPDSRRILAYQRPSGEAAPPPRLKAMANVPLASGELWRSRWYQVEVR